MTTIPADTAVPTGTGIRDAFGILLKLDQRDRAGLLWIKTRARFWLTALKRRRRYAVPRGATFTQEEDRETWQGPPSELLTRLVEVAETQKIDMRSRPWPKAAHILTRRLNEVRPNLQDAGVSITGRHSGDRSITIRKVPENSVQSVQASISLENQGFSGGRLEDATDAQGGSVQEATAQKPLQNKGDGRMDTTDATFPPSQVDDKNCLPG